MGQTAVKTRNALQSALGGVLFIDEAYALKRRDGDWFGQECIDTILKFIEDHREEMVVIPAGYPEQMDALLSTNPGFRSRFTQHLVFADYDDAELIDIFRGMLRSLGYRVEPPTEDVVARQLARERMSGAFGNGRAVRNLTERAIRRQAVRLDARRTGGAPISVDDLELLLPGDFEDPAQDLASPASGSRVA
jgi:AAA+ superfamily predicted ATPase